MYDVIVIGAGASGMMASVSAALAGAKVLCLEKNEKAGKKLFITGKGRCNLTNSCEMGQMQEKVLSNGRFLYSAFSAFSNTDVCSFFEGLHVPLKEERGGRIFPVSDHSSDIIRALVRYMEKLGVELRTNCKVTEINTALIAGENKKSKKKSKVTSVKTKDGQNIKTHSVIIATGGLSYPATGSTGDGYYLAEKMGHTITALYPSLTPVITSDDYIPRLKGLSLKNVVLRIFDGEKILFEDFGELLFTHFGISGPLGLSASACISSALERGVLKGQIDLKPALTHKQLDARILREFENGNNKIFKNVIGCLFPARLRDVFVSLAEVKPDKYIHDITRQERLSTVSLIKALPFTVTGLKGFDEAIITKGGVNVSEISPKDMQSKLVSGLYFAGEVMDLDAYTGGYNLQIAWSTGYLAGKSAFTY